MPDISGVFCLIINKKTRHNSIQSWYLLQKNKNVKLIFVDLFEKIC